MCAIRGLWLAALVAFDQASVAADTPGVAEGGLGPGSPKSSDFVDLDEADDLEEAVGGGNVARENEARRKQRKGWSQQQEARKRRRKRRQKTDHWKFYLAAGLAGSFILLVVAVSIITVLELFGVVI
jgi:hypothetical protein